MIDIDTQLVDEIDEAVDQARRSQNPQAVEIRNFTEEESDNGQNGKPKIIRVPRTMPEIIAEIKQRTGDWPRRIDNMLFVDDPEYGISFFDRRTKAALFGWLRRHFEVRWAGGGCFVGADELFAEIERTATCYSAVELMPHEPPIEGIYYRHEQVGHGSGIHLKQLLARFRPETTADRDLILAALLTVFWGGPAGTRPVFVITSTDGRGAGKSTLVKMTSQLCGGHISVSAGEDIATMKTRLLTPTAREKRIAFLDNVKTMRLSWAELEALVTETVISGRQNYVGEAQRPNLLSWFLTINGASMAPDMAQRSIIIRLAKGECVGAWEEETAKYINEHRSQIIADIVSLLKTPRELPETFQFSRWATWERNVLSRVSDPVDAQKQYLERQGVADYENDEAAIVEEFFWHQLAKFEYSPDHAYVNLPSEYAAAWYCRATKERLKVPQACRKLVQMIEEGQIKRLEPNSCKKFGRGFIWTGEKVTGPVLPNLDYGIRERKEVDPWHY